MTMLEYDLHAPARAAEGAPLIVLLHGRGADKHDLAGLRPHLPADALLVLPRAPFPGAAWGYGGGWAWYRYLGEDRPEPESFEESQRQLHDFLQALPATLPVRPGALVLGGFSQGGTMSLAYALRHPGAAPRVLNFSGFLADHPGVPVTRDSVRGTRVFWGHGTQDPNIPFALAERGRSRLAAVDAAVDARDYAIGHWIDPQELEDAVEWMGRA